MTGPDPDLWVPKTMSYDLTWPDSTGPRAVGSAFGCASSSCSGTVTCECRKPHPSHAIRWYWLITPPARVCFRTRYCSRSTGSGSGFSGAAESSDRCGARSGSRPSIRPRGCGPVTVAHGVSGSAAWRVCRVWGTNRTSSQTYASAGRTSVSAAFRFRQSRKAA